MMLRTRSKSRLAGVAAALWACAMVGGTAQARKVGDKLPNFTLKDINGKTVSLSSFKNRAVWITFFQST